MKVAFSYDKISFIKERKVKSRSFLLGLGFDTRDGHKRITRGKNFYIFGGSPETHHFMQEGCIKFNEELGKRHKKLNDISRQEFYDIAHKIGLKVVQEKNKGE